MSIRRWGAQEWFDLHSLSDGFDTERGRRGIKQKLSLSPDFARCMTRVSFCIMISTETRLCDIGQKH